MHYHIKGGQCPKCVRGAVPKNSSGNQAIAIGEGLCPIKREGNAQHVCDGLCPKNKTKNKKTKFFEGYTKTVRKKEGKTLTSHPFSVLPKIKIHTELN